MGQNASKISEDLALQQVHSLLSEILVAAQKGKFPHALLLIEETLPPMRTAFDVSIDAEKVKPLLISVLMFKGWILEQTHPYIAVWFLSLPHSVCTVAIF